MTAKTRTLEAAGLAKVTIVYLDDRGTMRTAVHTLPRKSLAWALRWISRRSVG